MFQYIGNDFILFSNQTISQLMTLTDYTWLEYEDSR